jgi:hypothetical protein
MLQQPLKQKEQPVHLDHNTAWLGQLFEPNACTGRSQQQNFNKADYLQGTSTCINGCPQAREEVMTGSELSLTAHTVDGSGPMSTRIGAYNYKHLVSLYLSAVGFCVGVYQNNGT